MISRNRSAPTAAAMSIECTTSANSTRDLLVLGGFGGGDYRRSALVAELVAGPQLGTARPAR